ncbi:hypothetical protein FDECE_14264 [Fusarium decemcellulare]|nr:hypothetical protein FDECE_14264 [Fusarium decemcellulare]
MAKSNTPHPHPRTLWTPSKPEATEMHKFMEEINHKHGLSIQDYWELYDYSISRRSQFWSDWFERANLIHSGLCRQVVDESKPIDTVPKWFDGVTLNFAENVLFTRERGTAPKTRGTRHKEHNKIAVTEVHEGGADVKHYDWDALRKDTAALASAFEARGIAEGDRIFAVASNSYVTLLLFLASAWVGAIFSSTSPDMGPQGILQRIKQTDPKFIFMDDGAIYNGQEFSLVAKATMVKKQIGAVSSLQSLVLIPRLPKLSTVDGIAQCETLDSFLSHAKATPPPVQRLPFHAPCMISYSSGTTGEPKCIVHCSILELNNNNSKTLILCDKTWQRGLHNLSSGSSIHSL